MADFDVVELPDTEHLSEGERAPDFTRPLVKAECWEDRSLSELAERNPVLLVFFPMDGTGMAKYTWIGIRDREWGASDLTVVGLSISTPYEHMAFIHRHRLPFGLFSDPGNGVADTFGIVHEHGGMTGVAGPRPSFFLLESDLTVEYAWVAQLWPPETDLDAVEAAIDSKA